MDRQLPINGHDAAHEGFTATHWSVVRRASACDDDQAHLALSQLCERYWKPLYSFVSRQGHSHEDACDLVQSFFARLLEKNYLKAADSEKGRFRTFMLTAIKRFMANDWRDSQRLKRGGGVQIVPIDNCPVAASPLAELVAPRAPESDFDREWALTLLARVSARLQQEFDGAAKSDAFAVLRVYLTADAADAAYAETGAKIGLTAPAMRVAVHRLRQRYRELIRSEIADTLSDASMVDAELEHLFAALG
jgi:RNA polymerase sigma factor (sigma-70 family)